MKKLVLISDLHGQKFTLTYLQRIIDQEKPDGIIVSGDITTGADMSFFDLLEDIIEKNKIDCFLIWGNSDIPYANQYIDRSKYSVHLREKKFGDFKIIGVGETDDPINISAKIKDKILVTHRPPQKGLLLKKFKNAPLVHINGHLHTQRTARQYPSTFHIIVPTLQNGEYAIFYPEIKKARFSRIS